MPLRSSSSVIQEDPANAKISTCAHRNPIGRLSPDRKEPYWEQLKQASTAAITAREHMVAARSSRQPLRDRVVCHSPTIMPMPMASTFSTGCKRRRRCVLGPRSRLEQAR